MREITNLIIIIALVLLPFVLFTTLSYSYDATDVDVRANITQSKPEVIAVSIDEGVNDPLNITLDQGAYRKVTCNATIRDYNGHSDINYTNATFYQNTTSKFDPDDNNTHYTNTSCVRYGDDGNFLAYYTCDFDVAYYANHGGWICNFTAVDNNSFTGTGGNQTEILELFAINVTNIIDFGELAVEDTSPIRQANITNFGNQNLSITVHGYGDQELDGLAMVCEYGNITIDNLRYSTNETEPWNTATQLTIGASTISNLTVLHQQNDTLPVTNTTYWQLYVEPNPFGYCNGTIVFEAQAALE